MEEKQFKILITDDNHKNIQIAANILQCDHYKLWYAKSGEDTLKKIEDTLFDIILLDIMMPGIDGFETVKRIKQKDEYNDVPIIFVTAKDVGEDIVEGFGSGGVDYITKPYKAVDLRLRVQTHLKLASQTKELKRMNDKLEFMAKKDFLTKINNRGNFFNLGEELYEKENDKNIYVVMLDIDKFKNLNDTYGHKLGDIALQEFTKEVEKHLDQDDIFGRLGGEEFAVLISCDDKTKVIEKLELLRQGVANIKIEHENNCVQFTVSMGMTQRHESEKLDTSLERADSALYEAKNGGRNRLEFRH